MGGYDVFLRLLFLFLMKYQAVVETRLNCWWKIGQGQLISVLKDHVGDTYVPAPDDYACEQEYLRQTSFICTGYNYRPPFDIMGISQEGVCELLAEHRDGLRVINVPYFSHRLRPLCSGIWLPWLQSRGFGSGLLAQRGESPLKKCKEWCYRYYSEQGKTCRLIERMKDKAVCNLYETRLEYGSSSSRNNRVYFERPSWYLDSSTAVTRQKERQNLTYIEINNVKHKFHKTEIVVSGYLVGWKFYRNQLKTSKYCDTTLAVVREITPNNYTVIAEHMLEGNYQFNQHIPAIVELITPDGDHARLKKGDMLTSVTSRTPDVNCTELIRNELVSESVFTNIPSLIAFVSEYLSLESPPLVYYNSSLNRSQAWLTIPAPPARDDNSVIYGYKIICAEDRELVKRFNCNLYDEVVSVSQKQVLLTLGEEIGTIFISLQVCRNFKGKELLDHAFSPVTRFCPNKTVTIRRVIVKEQSRTSFKVSTSITFSLHVQKGEVCLEGIKINVTGFEGEYLAANATKYTYSLFLRQGKTYDFHVYVKIMDGREIRVKTIRVKVPGGVRDIFLVGAAIGLLAALLVITITIAVAQYAHKHRPRRPRQQTTPSSEEQETAYWESTYSYN